MGKISLCLFRTVYDQQVKKQENPSGSGKAADVSASGYGMLWEYDATERISNRSTSTWSSSILVVGTFGLCWSEVSNIDAFVVDFGLDSFKAVNN